MLSAAGGKQMRGSLQELGFCGWISRCALFIFHLSLFTAFVLAGCGGPSDMAPAAGVVLVEGQPLPGGSIVLTPFGGGLTAIGDIQPDGRFVLVTRDHGQVAKIGKHRVTIVGPRSDDGETSGRAYRPPADFTLEVLGDQENDFSIEINRANGWNISTDD